MPKPTTKPELSRQEWLELRRSGIGGSDMPSILGIDPFGGSAYGVWLSKVQGKYKEEENPDINRGNFLEPIIRDLYRKETGNEVQTPQLQRHKVETWAIANFDGLILPEDGAPGVLEIKAPRASRFYALEDYGVPDYYQVQIQHYLGVTGLQWAHFCAWNADAFRLLIVRVERDQELINLMWKVAREFWQANVLTGIPPENPAGPTIRLPPLEPKLMLMESPEWEEAASEWREAKGILKEAEKYEAECKEKLVKMAIEARRAKVKGFDVTVSIDKNGVPRVRDGKKEDEAA